jgi:hypothetical protein
LAGLPFILSFALGYKFDTRTLKFTKSGLVAVKTQPPEASIYLNGNLLNEKTPASINELLPGEYDLRLELKSYYPWSGRVSVNAGKVTRLEKIILFPLRPDVKQLNKDKITTFWIDKNREKIYYINQKEDILYRSDLEGESFKEIVALPQIIPSSRKWKVSPDKEKLLYFNAHQIAIAYLEPQSGFRFADPPFVLDFPNFGISEVFWHSDSYHLVIITDRSVEATEAKPSSSPVNLINLNKKNAAAFYDEEESALYFVDSERAQDGTLYDNVYKMKLEDKFYYFQELIKSKTHE